MHEKNEWKKQEQGEKENSMQQLEKKAFWQSEDWQCVSYGNKEQLKWYREFLKRREEGASMEFYDVLSSDDYYLKFEINKDEIEGVD